MPLQLDKTLVKRSIVFLLGVSEIAQCLLCLVVVQAGKNFPRKRLDEV